VIKSCAKLWYGHAQAVIEGTDWNYVSPVEIYNGFSSQYVQNQIKTLFHISSILRKKRFDNGALSLNSLKLWFQLDEQDNPSDCGIYELKDANRLVEEVIVL
jgi:exoribonuclease R